MEAEFERCVGCSEITWTADQFDAAQRAASAAVRRAEDLLAPEEIRALRVDQLGLKQEEFERLLGTGVKTVVRWERGTVFQSVAADNLMRAMRAYPNVVRFLADRNGVVLPLRGVRNRVAGLDGRPAG